MSRSEENGELTEESKNNSETFEDQGHDEYQYLKLIEKIINTGARKNDRTGVGTYSLFGTHMRFNLQNGTSSLFLCFLFNEKKKEYIYI